MIDGYINDKFCLALQEVKAKDFVRYTRIQRNTQKLLPTFHKLTREFHKLNPELQLSFMFGMIFRNIVLPSGVVVPRSLPDSLAKHNSTTNENRITIMLNKKDLDRGTIQRAETSSTKNTKILCVIDVNLEDVHLPLNHSLYFRNCFHIDKTELIVSHRNYEDEFIPHPRRLYHLFLTGEIVHRVKMIDPLSYVRVQNQSSPAGYNVNKNVTGTSQTYSFKPAQAVPSAPLRNWNLEDLDEIFQMKKLDKLHALKPYSHKKNG